ncbi:hypothetical protein L2729_11775 [Shewanella gelidimarina]|uniref:hypothetical protein n=1 Tax=Shewanella gelidimarina TaxID=56813 RepID=UPI00201020F7|nr:hypothetical protein [Shewanella gelidimarina]MCL1058665.1 hypothetical protein [Shewanella gelidimarina]
MCKQVSYSKYQKRVIKFLNDLLGSGTPFSYERTKNNHLKVLIEGVSKPLYTGSTPSDCRSIHNFMSEVKKELRLSVHELEKSASMPAKLNPTIQSVFKPCYDKLIQTSIKSLRTQIDSIKVQEQRQVEQLNDVDFIKTARLKAIKHSVSHVIKTNKQAGYIKPRAMREIETVIVKHLNFMLPSIAFYSDLLESEKHPATDLHNVVNHETKVVSLASSKTARTKSNIDNTVANNEAKAVEGIKVEHKDHRPKQRALKQLVSLSSPKRVNELRSLNAEQGRELIKEIEQAMMLNREQDIEAIVALIQEKAIPLEAIVSRLEAA